MREGRLFIGRIKVSIQAPPYGVPAARRWALLTFVGESRFCVTHVCVIQKCVMNNPFEFGRELGTDELVDRADEVVPQLLLQLG
jgi:hypothetical protein